MRVLGVDGCPGGWVGALVSGGEIRWSSGSFADMLALRPDVLAVDIPIGLPVGPERRCADLEARELLGPQRSSVFFAPPRVVLEAGSQPEATRLSRAAGSVGVSIQTFHILAKVAEVDESVRAGGGPVIEVHPEVSFRRLAEISGASVAFASKRTARGREQRLSVLRRWLPGLTVPSPRPGRAAVDDCLDSAVTAWTGQRWLAGHAEVLGDEVDAVGVPMRIVV